MIRITNRISIPEEELSFTASLSSGPGGQNVNKLNTRVTLRFDLANSPSLSPEDKALIATRLATRIAKDGILRVVSQSTRSQHANRELAVERFVELLKSALKRAPVRKETRVSKAAKERRLEEKKLRSSVKRQRSKGNADNDRDM
ncbi:MAG TPA: alternative ribosome rescue aminoacyl-tRNA hydrolase ArfB [Syntrophobacter fumaroxidans]|nr:alternative ribosome rescue aminoacyl-tRNA hydrolase ArfB [Syntrophobacter fumaroxidans]